MKAAVKPTVLERQQPKLTDKKSFLHGPIKKSWTKIAPFWPLKNLIAVNPLHGFENLPFEKAIIEGASYFQQENIPLPMAAINRETIKWLQIFFDDGQATIHMPLRKKGLYLAWRHSAQFDHQLHGNDPKKKKFIALLPECPMQAVAQMLLNLRIESKNHEKFLTLLLTTLPGWASYIKYHTEWLASDNQHLYPVSQADYLAMRLVISYLLWPEAKALIIWHHQARNNVLEYANVTNVIAKTEKYYRLPLLKNIAAQTLNKKEQAEAQFVFCIDVRSEPFRRALESSGNYETYGFAGFFGVPVKIKDDILEEDYRSCPVLLAPKHSVNKTQHYCSLNEQKKDKERSNIVKLFKYFYQSLKYTFVSPFALVEMIGLGFGAWMGLRTFAPNLACRLKLNVISAMRPSLPINYSIEDIHFEDQCRYAENSLRMMGLTKDFSPLVILCGHGSTTENNAYATALDCGACAGRHGGANANILAKILNNINVRIFLTSTGITIPEETYFLAAEHNTTTDEVTLYSSKNLNNLDKLKHDLRKAREINSKTRCKQLGVNIKKTSFKHTVFRSHDWAQIRPEWGLARNAAFIVAPRELTKKLDLEGRCFLHSYDYLQDPDGRSLTTILTAPMVVANWINMQYLFSTIDNVAYGAGNKITKNITGKIGIMQGNASDLMTGLPLQSVYTNDQKPYHETQRLMTVVYAPRSLIDSVLTKQITLQKLFINGWVTLACIEPVNHEYYLLERDLTWQKPE